jgi:hypothetical protein
MAGTQRLLAIALSFLLAGIAVHAKPDVLGIVVGASGARLGAHSASEGTSVYDGDRLSTEAGGALRLRSGTSTLYLAEESCVVIHRNLNGTAGDFGAELVSGQAVLSIVAGSASEIVARGAIVTADSNGASIMQVKVLAAKELVIFARRGKARVSYREETEVILEGKTARVVLDPTDDAASKNRDKKKPPRKPRKALQVIIVGGAAVAAIIIPPIYGQRYESPDRP